MPRWRETLRRSGLDPAAVGSMVMGNVIQAGNRMNPARQAAIGGGLAVSVPAMTVNRVCGSGAQAVVSVAQQIAAGEIDAGVAGGMQNMDLRPTSWAAAGGATAWARRTDSRQHADRRAERCRLRRALRLAHRLPSAAAKASP